MQRQRIGSLVLALCFVSGPALAASMEPIPSDKQLEPIENREAELTQATLDLAFMDPSPESEEEPTEGFLPEMPILLDGKQYSAQELEKAGVHLSHYVLDEYAAEQNVMLGFRTTKDLQSYMDKTGRMPSEEPTPAQVMCTPGSFWDYTGYTGSRFSAYPGQAIGNLGGFWNDRISSLWAAPCSSWTVLFEHTYFRGHRLWLRSGWGVPNLGAYGWLGWHGWWPRWYSWNNRVSSLIVYW